MTEKVWIAIISGVVTPLFAVLGKILWDWWKRKKDEEKEQKEDKMGLYIKYLDQMYVLLEDFREKLNCSRAVVMKAENGGGIPKEGHQIYSSVLWETTDNNTESIRERWKRQPIDKEYAKVLKDLYVNEYVILETNKMNKSILKDHYISSNIEMSEKQKIYIDDSKFIYLGLNYVKGREYDTKDSKHKDNLRVLVAKLKDLFKKMHSLSEEG